MSTPSTPSTKNRIGLGLNRPRPSHLNTPFANAAASNFYNNNNSSSSSGLPPAPSYTQSSNGPLLSPSTMLARKASLNQLTQNSLASIPDGTMGYGLGLGSPTSMSRGGDSGLGGGRGRGTPVAGIDVDVGDQVNTPGGMHGTVKFIGSVKGKAGVFVGVELDPDMAGRGKNDGAVDGVRYFTTAHPNSGIFVPLARAQKRNSASSSNPPPTPTLLGLNSPTQPSALSPPSYSTPRRAESPFGFNNNNGNGNRSGIGLAPSSRPSLPRPESPVRKATPGPPARGLQPPGTPRNVSSAMGGRFGGPSQMPGKINYGRPRASSIASTVNGGQAHPERPGTATGFSGSTPRISHTPKHSGSSLGLKQPKNSGQSGLRSGSSLGMRSLSSLGRHSEGQEDLQEETSQGDSGIGLRAEENDYDHSNGGVGSGSTSALEDKLAEKDQQLQEQAAQLLEMEASFSELQSLIQNAQPPPITSPISIRGGNFEDADATQLRALLREKTERIQVLTAEFDAHRADFRSTIDTLELASTETERVYEIKVQELMNEIRELQERTEDVESVARQLKQLEELVAELEEGLEDARRGEAEARGEVEFLRGEVERCREELRREKEKSAAAVANAAVGKLMRTGSVDSEVEKKDDEIRGLKAIIHSLSRDAVTSEDGSHAAAHLGALRRVNGEMAEGDELTMERNTREKLEREVNELQGLIDRKATREDELEKEIEFLRKRKETRASGASGSISEKNASGINGSWGRSSGERHRPSFSAADTEGTGTATSASEGGSRGTVGSWRRTRKSSASSMAAADKEAAAPVVAAGGAAALAPITAESTDGSLWCEICETAGHEILNCPSMFGATAGGPAAAGPEGEKPLPTPPTTHSKEIVDDDDETRTIASDTDHIEPPLKINGNSNGVSPGSASFIEEEERRRIGGLERKKSIHLPAPPPMVSVDGSFGPVAGKESGVVEMDKWCAMCERDGHDSVDCPLDMDY